MLPTSVALESILCSLQVLCWYPKCCEQCINFDKFLQDIHKLLYHRRPSMKQDTVVLVSVHEPCELVKALSLHLHMIKSVQLCSVVY